MKKSRIVRYDSRNHKSRTDWSRIGHQTDETIAAAVKASSGDSKGKKANPARAHTNRGRAPRARPGK